MSIQAAKRVRVDLITSDTAITELEEQPRKRNKTYSKRVGAKADHLRRLEQSRQRMQSSKNKKGRLTQPL